MLYLFFILLCGVSFSPVFVPSIDIWHAQGIYAQAVIMVMFSASMCVERNTIIARNQPMALFNLWIGGLTTYICFYSQWKYGRYDVAHFFPYFNFLCLLIVYRCVLDHLDAQKILKVLEGLRIVVIVTLVTCVLQKFGMAQFFEMLHPDNRFHNNPVVGWIGNGTHLSGFLAMSIPLFLMRFTRENVIALIAIALVLTQTSTESNDFAMSGYIVGVCVVLFFLWKSGLKRIFWGSVAASIVSVVWLAGSDALINNGRFGLWETYLPYMKQRPVTGQGLGTMNLIYQTVSPNFRHMHMEFYQLAFECGIIGLILAVNVIYRFFKIRFTDRLQIVLASMVLGFLVSCCFNWTAHLWVPSLWAMFAYAAIYCIKNQEILNA